MKFDISSGLQTAKNLITANSPVLLVGTAIAGVVTTGVLAARGGYKARGIIDEAQAERGEDELTLQEKAQLTWLCYAPATLTATTAVASTVGVHLIHNKRNAALAGLYAMTATRLDAYSDEAEKILGTKKTQELNDKYATRRIGDKPLENSEIIITEFGNQIIHDDFTGRWFAGSIAKLEEAANEISRLLLTEDSVSLNDFHDLIGLPNTTVGGMFGWSGGEKVMLSFGGDKTPDGQGALSFWFQNEPRFARGR